MQQMQPQHHPQRPGAPHHFGAYGQMNDPSMMGQYTPDLSMGLPGFNPLGSLNPLHNPLGHPSLGMLGHAGQQPRLPPYPHRGAGSFQTIHVSFF